MKARSPQDSLGSNHKLPATKLRIGMKVDPKKDGKFYIWDGNHRTGLSHALSHDTIHAFVGVPKPRCRRKTVRTSSDMRGKIAMELEELFSLHDEVKTDSLNLTPTQFNEKWLSPDGILAWMLTVSKTPEEKRAANDLRDYAKTLLPRSEPTELRWTG